MIPRCQHNKALPCLFTRRCLCLFNVRRIRRPTRRLSRIRVDPRSRGVLIARDRGRHGFQVCLIALRIMRCVDVLLAQWTLAGKVHDRNLRTYHPQWISQHVLEWDMMSREHHSDKLARTWLFSSVAVVDTKLTRAIISTVQRKPCMMHYLEMRGAATTKMRLETYLRSASPGPLARTVSQVASRILETQNPSRYRSRPGGDCGASLLGEFSIQSLDTMSVDRCCVFP